jgi:ubiquinone/menaquinone biosynthesis C-methylase UbiE
MVQRSRGGSPGGREAQDEVFAEDFRDHAEDGFYNAYYDRPACLGLLGDIVGQRVLDAACGPGLYAEELVRRGARVSGFDQSPAMVRLARERTPQADFRVHDAGDPLDWLPDGCVDAVLLALALEYLDDRLAALRELHRVLRPWGRWCCRASIPPGTGCAMEAATSTSG